MYKVHNKKQCILFALTAYLERKKKEQHYSPLVSIKSGVNTIIFSFQLFCTIPYSHESGKLVLK